jgi:hypothetical protein
MTKIAGSGSISQKHGSADPDPDPDPPQNVMDPQHCFYSYIGILRVHYRLQYSKCFPRKDLKIFF